MSATWCNPLTQNYKLCFTFKAHRQWPFLVQSQVKSIIFFVRHFWNCLVEGCGSCLILKTLPFLPSEAATLSKMKHFISSGGAFQLCTHISTRLPTVKTKIIHQVSNNLTRCYITATYTFLLSAYKCATCGCFCLLVDFSVHHARLQLLIVIHGVSLFCLEHFQVSHTAVSCVCLVIFYVPLAVFIVLLRS